MSVSARARAGVCVHVGMQNSHLRYEVCTPSTFAFGVPHSSEVGIRPPFGQLPLRNSSCSAQRTL